MPHIEGTFKVELTPQEPDPREGAEGVGRMAIDKTFAGPLAAHSAGQMLAYRSPVEGSAGYVALEKVAGTLDGRAGTFVLQHSGHATAAERTLYVNVVADSGTGELSGLSGEMQIIVDAEGGHSYVFDYELD